MISMGRRWQRRFGEWWAGTGRGGPRAVGVVGGNGGKRAASVLVVRGSLSWYWYSGVDPPGDISHIH